MSELVKGVSFMFSKELFGAAAYVRSQNAQHHETQTDLGKVHRDIAKSRVSEMECGKKTTTAEKIALICEHYNISSDYLLGLTDDPEPKGQKKR